MKPVDESTSYHDKLSELRLAQSGLLNYLRRCMDEDDMKNIDDTETVVRILH